MSMRSWRLRGLFAALVSCAASLSYAQIGPTGGPPVPAGIVAVCWVDGVQYPSVAAAVTACPGKNIVIATAQTVSTVINVTGARTRISCINGAVVAMTAAGSLRLQGDESGVSDCHFTGPGVGVASSAGVQLYMNGGDRTYFRNNVVTAFGSTSSNGTVAAGSGNYGEISGNTIYANAESGIFLNNVTASATMKYWNIKGNTVDNGILVYPSGTNSVVSDVTISNNIVMAGVGSGVGATSFCINPQAQGTGATLTNVAIVGNTCTLAANGTPGGYSVVIVNGFTMDGNTFNANSHTYTIDAFEVIQASNGTVNGNIANSGTGGPGFECNTCTNVTLSGNTQNGFASGSFGIRVPVGDVAASLTANNISVTGNVVNFSTGASGTGIYIYSDNAGATGRGYSVIGNTVRSDGTAGSTGIVVTNTAGTLGSVHLGPNTIVGPATGYNVSASVTPFCLVAGFNSATTAQTLASTSACENTPNATFTTSIIDPLVIGGTGTTSALTFKTTTGVGTTNADMIFQVGNNGATEAMRILNSGKVGVASASPQGTFDVGTINTWDGLNTGRMAIFNGPNSPITGGGNVRINSTDSAADDLGGSLTFGGYYTSTTNSYNFAGIAGRKQAGLTTGGYLQFGTTDNLAMISEKMRITSTGVVAIATTAVITTGDILAVNGQATMNNKVFHTGLTTASGTPGSLCYNTSTNEMTKNNALTCTVSSLRFKHDFEPLNKPALPVLMAMVPGSFVYNDDDRQRVGFAAEYMAGLDLRLADGWDEKGPRSIDQNAILAIAIKSIQELASKVEVLEAKSK